MSILPAIVAMILMLGAIGFATYSLYIIFQWPRVSGTILRYHRTHGSQGSHWNPVFRFQTIDGKTYVAISSWGSWDRPRERGATVQIRYSPDNPQRSEIQCFGNMWGVAFTMAALALIFWAVAFWFPRIGNMVQ